MILHLLGTAAGCLELQGGYDLDSRGPRKVANLPYENGPARGRVIPVQTDFDLGIRSQLISELSALTGGSAARKTPPVRAGLRFACDAHFVLWDEIARVKPTTLAGAIAKAEAARLLLRNWHDADKMDDFDVGEMDQPPPLAWSLAEDLERLGWSV